MGRFLYNMPERDSNTEPGRTCASVDLDDDDDDDIRFCIAALRPVTAYVAATYIYTSYVCTTGVGDEM